MIYAMSDIHGQYKAYMKMLQLIGFTDEDTLYVIGDVIDRGKHGIAILLDMMERDNVILLRGNHEQIMIDRYSHCRSVVPVEYGYWLYGLGGKYTEEAYHELEPKQRRAVLEYLNATPLQLHIEVGGLRYHLAHGYPGPEDDPEMILWERLELWDTQHLNPEPDDCVVFGHTPTYFYTKNDYRPMSIYFGNHVIGIDCGCAFRRKPGRLGCLRLDDLKEYYVNIWQ